MPGLPPVSLDAWGKYASEQFGALSERMISSLDAPLRLNRFREETERRINDLGGVLGDLRSGLEWATTPSAPEQGAPPQIQQVGGPAQDAYAQDSYADPGQHVGQGQLSLPVNETAPFTDPPRPGPVEAFAGGVQRTVGQVGSGLSRIGENSRPALRGIVQNRPADTLGSVAQMGLGALEAGTAPLNLPGNFLTEAAVQEGAPQGPAELAGGALNFATQGGVEAVSGLARGAMRAPGAIRSWADDALERIGNLGAFGDEAVSTGIVTNGPRRLFHGTGRSFETPDPSRFDPNGMFGPGYYLTDDARVASAYADAGAAAQVRPVDAPPGLRLLDADAPLDPQDFNAVARYVNGADAAVPDVVLDKLGGLAERAGTGRGVSGSELWEALKPNDLRTPEANALANGALAAAGFDGIRYGGGRIVPVLDDTGRAVQHTAYVVFPESLGKLRNGLSGAPGGIKLGGAFGPAAVGARAAATPGERAFDLATGTAGAVAGAATADEDAPWQERAKRAIFGAALGAPAGASLRALAGAGVADEALGAARGAAQQLSLPGMATGPTRRRLAGVPVPTLGEVTDVAQSIPLAGANSLFTNFISGAWRTVQRYAQDSAGALGDANANVLKEAWADLGGMGAAIPHALAEAARTVRQGPSQQGAQMLGSGSLANQPGKAAAALTIGTRLNAASDDIWRIVNEAGARARAVSQGASPSQANAAAQRGGDFATYAGQVSPLAEALTKARQWVNDPAAHPAKRATGLFVSTFAPYVRMPERVLVAAVGAATDPLLLPIRAAAGRTALGKAWRAGDPVARREVAGRIAVGVALDTWLAAEFGAGNLFGPPPRDRNQRLAEEAQGAKWETLHGLPLRAFGTFGQAASGLAATLAGVQRSLERGDDPTDQVRAGINEALRWTLDESYISDIARFGAAVGEGKATQELERAGAGFATRYVSPIASPINAADPYEREVEGFGGQVLSRLPGGRFALPVREDPRTDEPLRRAGSGFTRAFGERGTVQTEAMQAAGNLAQQRTAARASALRGLRASDGYKRATPAQRKQMEEATTRAVNGAFQAAVR